jgi:hypothetical protein
MKNYAAIALFLLSNIAAAESVVYNLHFVRSFRNRNGELKFVTLENEAASYTLSCNEGEESCLSPAVNEAYSLRLIRPVGNARKHILYNCEEVSLDDQNGHWTGGWYCLDSTEAKR